ncbi:NAD(P)-dependent oxidoreductase [Planctomonas deserti]|uniref:NAD(P)-dependent oxidoreductase n=1 Tax=Planctomonas deserti TaxID=2144185 RepID=UPI000D336ABC|nr:NAD(P)H-binding protein [Planctomonas deserti]
MARITVLGGTGYAGHHIVTEAAARGHEVTSYSRSEPTEKVDGVTYVAASVLDENVLAEAVAGADVVFETISPRGEMADELEGVVARLIALAADAGVRLGVLGGAGSLRVAPEGPRLVDTGVMPEEILPEVHTGIALLEALQKVPAELSWFYVSPAGGFGAYAPGERTGQYRVGKDVLLVDDSGESRLSGQDLAVAVVDEIEHPAHHRERFHVAY